jgi:Heparinase II/III-like protein
LGDAAGNDAVMEPHSDRAISSDNSATSARGARSPIRPARSLLPLGADEPDFGTLDKAVTEFKSAHPYLLFHEPAAAAICKRAAKNSKLLYRLDQSLLEKSSADNDELRHAIKRRSRRLIHIAFLTLISDGQKREDALRATREALSAFAEEPTWKPRPVIKSFLDCAEIAVAVSLAYDWLYDELSGGERRAVEESLLRHVIEPALAAYDDRFMLWPKRRDNCTVVSNSGILVAALAILEHHRALGLQILRNSIASSWRSFDVLAPDGAWAEGLSYWSLAMRYAGLLVAALESTFGHSFGLADRPGFAQTGDFALHAVGTSGAAFNFGDSEPKFDVSPLAWFAHRFKRPSDARLLRRYDGWYLPFTAIWAGWPKPNTAAARQPTGKLFHSYNLACFRNTWSTAPAGQPVYLAIKGGNAVGGEASARPEDIILHAQADAGSFIVDGARRRWVMDLGSDDYDLPGYFDHGTDTIAGPRWEYYRTQTVGHNTLVVNGRNQIPNAPAPIIGSCIEGQRKWAIFDLSAAYGKPAGSIRRGAALIGRQVLIQDEVGPEVLDPITWAVHTSAEPVSVAGSVARFRSDDDRFVVRILEPENARFDLVFPPEPSHFPIVDVRKLHGRSIVTGGGIQVSELPRRADSEGERAAGALIRRLQIAWPKGVHRLTVLLLPDCDDEEFALPMTALNEWLTGYTVRFASYRRPTYWVQAKENATVGVRPKRTELMRNSLLERTRNA